MPEALSPSLSSELFESEDTTFRFNNYLCDTIVPAMLPHENHYCSLQRPIDDAIRENFRTSFKLSTESPFLQVLLQARVVDILHLVHNDQSVRNIVETTTFDPTSFNVPKLHATEEQTRLGTPFRERAENIWDVYMDVCKNRFNLELIKASEEFGQDAIDSIVEAGTPEAAGFFITFEMIGRELHYLEHGRPGRTTDDSRYRSLIHDYSFHGKPTGTPEGDFIMKEVGILISTLCQVDIQIPIEEEMLQQIRDDFMKLVRAWEWRHERSFFDDSGLPVFKRLKA